MAQKLLGKHYREHSGTQENLFTPVRFVPIRGSPSSLLTVLAQLWISCASSSSHLLAQAVSKKEAATQLLTMYFPRRSNFSLTSALVSAPQALREAKKEALTTRLPSGCPRPLGGLSPRAPNAFFPAEVTTRHLVQAVREPEKQAAHDAAVVGLPVDSSGDAAPGTKKPDKAPVVVPGVSEGDEEDGLVFLGEEPLGEAQQPVMNAGVRAAST